jgi:hypothetical protein
MPAEVKLDESDQCAVKLQAERNAAAIVCDQDFLIIGAVRPASFLQAGSAG